MRVKNALENVDCMDLKTADQTYVYKINFIMSNKCFKAYIAHIYDD